MFLSNYLHSISISDILQMLLEEHGDNLLWVGYFGSHLRGYAREDSDHDLTVVLDEGKPWHTETVRKIDDVELQNPVDLIFYSQEHLLDHLNYRDTYTFLGNPIYSNGKFKKPSFEMIVLTHLGQLRQARLRYKNSTNEMVSPRPAVHALVSYYTYVQWVLRGRPHIPNYRTVIQTMFPPPMRADALRSLVDREHVVGRQNPLIRRLMNLDENILIDNFEQRFDKNPREYLLNVSF